MTAARDPHASATGGTLDDTATRAPAGPASPAPAAALYPRLLRLRHIHPNAWQRAVLGEGVLILAALLVLADLATAWALLILPLAVAVVVKAHDLLAGVLERPLRSGGTAGRRLPSGPHGGVE